MAKKWQQSPRPVDNRVWVELGPSDDPEKRVKIYEDGTLEAENIRERDSKNLSLDFSEKGNKYYFNKKLDENTVEEYIPLDVTKQYRTKISRKFEIKQAFAVYQGDVRKFVIRELDRFRALRKGQKKAVGDVLATKNEYIFTTNRFGSPWNKIFIDSNQFGPYNYDTKLVVSRDIDFINDIIVIRTGNTHTVYDKSSNSYVVFPSGNTIVWVSPHEILNYSGQGNFITSGDGGYTSVVAPSGSNQSGVTYYSRDHSLVNNTGCYALSSRFIKILADEQLKTDINFESIGTEKVTPTNQDWPLENSLFFYAYPEYKEKVLQGNWGGVVPSGASISIETWSTNPKYVGFDGDISILPVNPTDAENIDVSYTIEGEGVSWDYQASVRKAVDAAKRKFYRKLNKVLVDKGCKKKNKRTQRYERMLERVAQNIYDGLGIVRNEHVAKLQVTPVDPADSPLYYDGTSELYGGSMESSSYDALYTSIARGYEDLSMTDTSSDQSTTSSGGGASGGSSSSEGGSY